MSRLMLPKDDQFWLNDNLDEWATCENLLAYFKQRYLSGFDFFKKANLLKG